MEVSTVEATEPKTTEQLVDSLFQPETNEDSNDDSADAPEIAEDQTEVTESVDDAEAEEVEAEADVESTEDDEAGNDDAPERPQSFKVKVDGEEVEVPLEELTRSYSGQQYIQKGMKEAAEAQKRATEQLRLFEQQQQQVHQLIEYGQQGGFVPPTPPDIDMLQSDPIGYMEQKAQYDMRAAEYQNAMQVYQHNQQLVQQQQQEAYNAHLAEQKSALVAAIPDLADPEKRATLQGKVRDIGVNEYGLTEQEIGSIADHRYARILFDAMKYHDLMRSTAKATAKVEAARPVAKAGAKPKTDPNRAKERKTLERFKKTGSDDALADYLFKG